MGMACMENPLSLWHFYLRNKRKVLPVIGILALAILGVVVTDSLLASARETAYATFGSYQKLILVAPRATRDQDLANPLQDSLTRLHEVQLQVDTLDGPGGISSYYNAVVALPAQVRAQLPAVQQLQVDAANARYYAARLRGDLVPLGDLIVRVQRPHRPVQGRPRPSDAQPGVEPVGAAGPRQARRRQRPHPWHRFRQARCLFEPRHQSPRGQRPVRPLWTRPTGHGPASVAVWR